MAGNSKVVSFLKQPYPFYYEGRSFAVIFAILFLMSFGFNYFFKPFNVNLSEHIMPYEMTSLMHSLAAVIVLLFFFFFLYLFPRLKDNWNVRKEIYFLGLLLLFIGIAQFLIRDIIYDNPHNWSWNYFFEEIRNTFLVGMLFVLILVPLNFSRLYYKNQKQAGALSLWQTEEKDSAPVFIKTSLKSDDFYLDSSHLVFAKSEGNYVEVYLTDNGNIVSKLKRISLKELERQLRDDPKIVKTHRSFLVNIQFIEEIAGNAQGYKLKLKNWPDSISVSRNMISSFENSLRPVS